MQYETHCVAYYKTVRCNKLYIIKYDLRSGSVVFFPINAPRMGRFKLFDLVGYD